MPVKMIDPGLAAGMYAKTSGVGAKPGIGVEKTSFSDFLQDKVADSIQSMKAGEKTQAQAITGEADLADVVQAVTAAETTLQTVVAIRDRMIAAYQDIMRMPI
jgi:flagellar hook-basal body complex protein FliE